MVQIVQKFIIDRQQSEAVSYMRDLDDLKKITTFFIFKLLDDKNTMEFNEKSMIEALEINETVRDSKLLL